LNRNLSLGNAALENSGLENSAPQRRLARFGILSAAFIVAALAAGPSLAHQTFLLPGKFVWDAGERVDVALTSALSFPDLQFAPTRDRISFTSVVVDNKAVDDLSYDEKETFLNVSFMPDRAGFAVAAMSSKARFGEISAEDTSDYLDEIGASDAVRQAFEALPGEPPLNRSYSKHTKTFFCVETCSTGGEASLAPVGQPLEFLAVESDPNTFLLLRDGEPLAGHAVTVVSPDFEVQELTTGKDGLVHVDASLMGVAMISSIWITLPDQADGVYHSDYATLTIDRTRAP
jgi:uncharacterized protein DUF4198